MLMISSVRHSIRQHFAFIHHRQVFRTLGTIPFGPWW